MNTSPSRRDAPSDAELAIARSILPELTETDDREIAFTLALVRDDLARSLGLSIEQRRAFDELPDGDREALIADLRGMFDHCSAFSAMESQAVNITAMMVRQRLQALVIIPSDQVS